jgi:hypothetical protein
MRQPLHLAAVALTALLLPSPASAQAHKATGQDRHQKLTSGRKSKLSADPKQIYRSFWPQTIPLTVAYKDGHRSVVQVKGPAYWDTLSASTRLKLDTFNKLQGYCQTHEGSTNY